MKKSNAQGARERKERSGVVRGKKKKKPTNLSSKLTDTLKKKKKTDKAITLEIIRK